MALNLPADVEPSSLESSYGQALGIPDKVNDYTSSSAPKFRTGGELSRTGPIPTLENDP